MYIYTIYTLFYHNKQHVHDFKRKVHVTVYFDNILRQKTIYIDQLDSRYNFNINSYQ